MEEDAEEVLEEEDWGWAMYREEGGGTTRVVGAVLFLTRFDGVCGSSGRESTMACLAAEIVAIEEEDEEEAACEEEMPDRPELMLVLLLVKRDCWRERTGAAVLTEEPLGLS